jgi:hypothetical protein
MGFRKYPDFWPIFISLQRPGIIYVERVMLRLVRATVRRRGLRSKPSRGRILDENTPIQVISTGNNRYFEQQCPRTVPIDTSLLKNVLFYRKSFPMVVRELGRVWLGFGTFWLFVSREIVQGSHICGSGNILTSGAFLLVYGGPEKSIWIE